MIPRWQSQYATELKSTIFSHRWVEAATWNLAQGRGFSCRCIHKQHPRCTSFVLRWGWWPLLPRLCLFIETTINLRTTVNVALRYLARISISVRIGLWPGSLWPDRFCFAEWECVAASWFRSPPDVRTFEVEGRIRYQLKIFKSVNVISSIDSLRRKASIALTNEQECSIHNSGPVQHSCHKNFVTRTINKWNVSVEQEFFQTKLLT